MLYLAQVYENPLSGQKELQLLAHQLSAQVWQLLGGESIVLEKEQHFREGFLLLVELGDNQKILKLESARDWVLGLVQKYLIPEVITSEFLHQEEVRIEQWRQEMTVQGLELTRRQLEIETHRDQLQELENSLKQEKEKLELLWLQLQQRQRELEGI